MSQSKHSLSGVFPPIPTPFKAEGGIDFQSLESNLERWAQEPIAGYVVGGSNGEFVSMSLDECVEVVHFMRSRVPAERLLIAGSGLHSTRGTIELTKRMADSGADQAIVVTPSYYKSKMTAAALEKYYSEVADQSSIPVILYNVPANTAVDLPAESAIRLSKHENVIGIKESGGILAKIGKMVHESRPGFQVLAGSAGFFLPALSVGAVGVIAALANIAAGRLAQIHELFLAGELAQAKAIQLSVIEANTAVTARFGVAGVKAAMDMCSFYGGPVREPLLPLTSSEGDELRSILQGAGLIETIK